MDDNSSDKNDNADCCLMKNIAAKPIQPNNNNINGKHCVEVKNADNSTLFRHQLSKSDGENPATPGYREKNGFDQHPQNSMQQLNNTSGSSHRLAASIDDQCCLTNLNSHLHNADVEVTRSAADVSTSCRKSNDDTDASEENCSNPSTSTDNLSFISESDLINDIVILPNLISEDEISVNSDDCVYAYRGGDIDLVNGTQTSASQDDETDFLEMDFEPDPPSEIEIYSDAEHNAMNRSLNAAAHKNCPGTNGISEEDFKIPREIDKIAEVVELNNSRTRENIVEHSTSDMKALHQRLDCCSTSDNSMQADNCVINHNIDSIVPILEPTAVVKPEKYTGTKPKIKSNRQTNHGSEISTEQKRGTSPDLMLNFDNSLTQLTSKCFECDEEQSFYGNTIYWSTAVASHISCNKCQFKTKTAKALHCGKGLDYIDISCCSYPKEKNIAINCPLPSDDLMLNSSNNLNEPLNPVDYENYTKLVPSPAINNRPPAPTKFVNIQTNACGEKELIEALTSIDLCPNLEILHDFFNQITDTTFLSIPEYVVHVAKENCDYKALIDVIKRSLSSDDCIDIEFFPNLTPEIDVVNVSVKDIVSRWTIDTNLRHILEIKNKRFRVMNVLGKVANAIREFANEDLQACQDRTITIPQYYQSGYITITKF